MEHETNAQKYRSKLNFGKYKGEEYSDTESIRKKYPETEYFAFPLILPIKRMNVYHGKKMFTSAESAIDSLLNLLKDKDFEVNFSGFILGDIGMVLYFNGPLSLKEKLMNDKDLLERLSKIVEGKINS